MKIASCQGDLCLVCVCDLVRAWMIVDSGEAPTMSVSPLLLMLDFLEIVVACRKVIENLTP